MPEWATGPDGRATSVSGDVRLPGLFAEWQGDACAHPARLIVKRTDALGRAFYNEFCDGCGAKLSSAIAHHKIGVVSDISSEELEQRSENYARRRGQLYDRMATDAAERAQPGNRETYDDYLRSDAWKRRAAKVISRANGVCEGCLTKAAAEVHHQTYAHLGNEFAFELLALCEACHRRYHQGAQ